MAAATDSATEAYRALDLEAHALLAGVPLHDVHLVELRGGGDGRTLDDVRALASQENLLRGNVVVRALFALRFFVGRLLGWDAESASHTDSYVNRVPHILARMSRVPPGSPDGIFRALYVLERESLSEVRNATVHAFLSQALVPVDGGYRLYWAAYVAPISRWTRLYMAAIDPFRRFVVYPSLLRRLRRAWNHRHAVAAA